MVFFFFFWQKLTLCKKVEQARLSRRVGRRRRRRVEMDFRRRVEKVFMQSILCLVETSYRLVFMPYAYI